MKLIKKLLNSQTDIKEWYEILDKIPKSEIDIYHSPEYVNLSKLGKENVEGYMFVVWFDDKIWLNIFLKLTIPHFIKSNKGYYDLETPYGYGGPVSNTNDVFFLEKANNFYLDWIKSNNIVAELTRFHPLSNFKYENFFSKNFFSIKKTCSLDLSLVNENFDPFKSRVKNKIRLSKKNLTAHISQEENDFTFFKEIYLNLMQLKSARDDYFFSKDYFVGLFKIITKEGFMVIVKDKNNNKLAAGVFLYGGQRLNYHLSAFDKNYNYPGVMNLLIYHAALHAKKIDLKILHLGGGNSTDDNDALFKFKKSMSNTLHEFNLFGRIHDKKLYDMFKKKWRTNFPDLYDKYKDFFLSYHYKK